MKHHALELATAATPRAIAMRRDLHQHPELAFTEFRTANIVAKRLRELGVEVQCGRRLMAAEFRYDMPSAEELERVYRRAQAADPKSEFLESMQGGFPAVIATIKGARSGPTLGIRVDMDALPIDESKAPTHKPAKEGFVSSYPGLMHSCAHDAHTATGLGVAEVLAQMKNELCGTVKLIFQPGEEGCRGALPMMKAGVVDDVDCLISIHFGMEVPSATVWPRVDGFLTTNKLDVVFKGEAAHAGGSPERGRNALLAAAQATLGLYGISRHAAGASRVNVGTLQAGCGRNVIADHAEMMIELRGETDEINAYMVQRARAVIEGAARAQNVEAAITHAGSSTTAPNDAELAAHIATAALEVGGLKVMNEPHHCTGSEDATYFMRRVQERGGLATYMCFGSDIPTGHHTPTFDINESDIGPAIATLALAALSIGKNPPAKSK